MSALGEHFQIMMDFHLQKCHILFEEISFNKPRHKQFFDAILNIGTLANVLVDRS
jgi:hypothetical protein